MLCSTGAWLCSCLGGVLYAEPSVHLHLSEPHQVPDARHSSLCDSRGQGSPRQQQKRRIKVLNKKANFFLYFLNKSQSRQISFHQWSYALALQAAKPAASQPVQQSTVCLCVVCVCVTR